MRMQLLPPATKRRTKASNCPAVWASSDEVGSSRMTSSSGSSVTVKARATSTIWRLPIDRSLMMSEGLIPCPGNISSSFSVIRAAALRRQPKPRSEA